MGTLDSPIASIIQSADSSVSCRVALSLVKLHRLHDPLLKSVLSKSPTFSCGPFLASRLQHSSATGDVQAAPEAEDDVTPVGVDVAEGAILLKHGLGPILIDPRLRRRSRTSATSEETIALWESGRPLI